MFAFPFSRELKKRKVKLRFREDIEPHEIFLDKLAQKKEEELGISEKKFEVPLLKKILQGFLIVSFILILILFVKTFQLQVIESKNFSALAEGNKFIIYQIRAERGVIYDQGMRQLVFNQPSFDLVADIRDLPQNEDEKLKVLREISGIIKSNFEDLRKKIDESEEFLVLIAENLDHQTLILLETKITELSGFRIQNNTVRDYKLGSVISHLLGFTGKINPQELKAGPDFYSIFDLVGRSGIEKSYEEVLRKNPGKLQLKRDARGNLISQEVISLPESGKSLVLWLDSELQRKIYEELEKKLQELGTKKAAALAIDPKTGGVLAMVSLPSFDNNLFSQEITPSQWRELSENPLEPLNNRALSGQYLIGSTIKPLIALAALEEKIISPNKFINDEKGQIEIPHKYDPEIVYVFKDWAIHGWTDLRKAIAESCNVYFYTIGGGYGKQEGLGPSKIKKYLQLFGWGEKSKIDLPIPEWATGLVPDPEWKKKEKGESWWDGDTYHFSIGQGYILVTPLQVATAFSAIANGGTLYQPQALQKIVDSQKNLIEEIEPKIIRQNFIDPKNIQIVREGMRWAVTGQNSPQATAILLNTLPVSAAAKTGTAQVFRRGCENCYHIWISVFAPYENPKIVLTLMFEDIRGLPPGLVAVPVAKEILNWYFTK